MSAQGADLRICPFLSKISKRIFSRHLNAVLNLDVFSVKKGGIAFASEGIGQRVKETFSFRFDRVLGQCVHDEDADCSCAAVSTQPPDATGKIALSFHQTNSAWQFSPPVAMKQRSGNKSNSCSFFQSKVIPTRLSLSSLWWFCLLQSFYSLELFFSTAKEEREALSKFLRVMSLKIAKSCFLCSQLSKEEAKGEEHVHLFLCEEANVKVCQFFCSPTNDHNTLKSASPPSNGQMSKQQW